LRPAILESPHAFNAGEMRPDTLYRVPGLSTLLSKLTCNLRVLLYKLYANLIFVVSCLREAMLDTPNAAAGADAEG